MTNTRKPVSLLQRLRRMPALRVLLVFAAILASQNTLACALEESSSAAPVEWVANDAATPESPADGGCCAFCTDCAHSGGCCSFASSARAGAEEPAPAIAHEARLRPEDSAPSSWTPPTLLRPPILLA
jgi:hypothetical protein